MVPDPESAAVGLCRGVCGDSVVEWGRAAAGADPGWWFDHGAQRTDEWWGVHVQGRVRRRHPDRSSVDADREDHGRYPDRSDSLEGHACREACGQGRVQSGPREWCADHQIHGDVSVLRRWSDEVHDRQVRSAYRERTHRRQDLHVHRHRNEQSRDRRISTIRSHQGITPTPSSLYTVRAPAGIRPERERVRCIETRSTSY